MKGVLSSPQRGKVCVGGARENLATQAQGQEEVRNRGDAMRDAGVSRFSKFKS